MPSRLSSLLVRDGLLGVKRMERAFQRQVIYGGALDTILLEMSLIDEATLSEYLSLATGLPPAGIAHLEALSSDVAERCDLETSRSFHVVPLIMDGDALRVLVCEPVDFSQLEDLADKLDVAIQPLIVPEFRFHLTMDMVFGRSGDARFHRLVERVSQIEPSKRAPIAEDLLEAPRKQVIGETESSADTDTGRDIEPDLDAIANPATTTGSDLDAMTERDTEPDLDEMADLAAEPDLVDDTPDREVVDVPLPPASGFVHTTLRMSSDRVADRLAQSPKPRHVTEAYRIVHPAHVSPVDVPESSGVADASSDVPAESLLEMYPEIATSEADAPAQNDSRSSIRYSASHSPFDDEKNHYGVVSGEIEAVTHPMSPTGDSVDSATGGDSVTGGDGVDSATGGDSATGDSVTGGDSVDSVDRATGDSVAGQVPILDPAVAPLPLAEAEKLLAVADGRDLIFTVLLRGLLSVADYSALLAVQGGAVMGRMAIDDGIFDTEVIASILIPLGLPSPFQEVVRTGSPYIGKLASGISDVDEQIRALGGVMPPSGLLLPVALRNRVVAIAVGHSRQKNIAVTELADSFRLAQAAASALVRLIRASKTRSVALQESVSKRSDTAPEPLKQVVDPQPPIATSQLEVTERRRQSLSSGPVRDPEIEKLLDDIESSDQSTASAAQQALIGRAAEVVPYLDGRFPGKLKVDRYEVGWRSIRAGQYGAMMELVVNLGAPCGPMLATKLADSRRDVRYYAAVCAAELRPEAALVALVECLFDHDYGVRDIAIHALGGYPVRELAIALKGARKALGAADSERVMAAANALAVLGDLRAIPALLELLDGGRDVVEPARRALRRLTAQDFGTSRKKWRTWWNKNGKLSRIEWLLDSLSHRDGELRRHAINDLRRLTGESFDYVFDANKKERELGRLQWLEWWESTGRQQFSTERSLVKSGEHSRETAKLPQQT